MSAQIEKILTEATVCFLYKDGQILLAYKTKKIGKDCWNGYGGGPEKDETIEECALRELKEETDGVIATKEDIEKIAIVHFHNTLSNGEQFTCTVHFFLVYTWKGEPQATEEMIKPTWFPINNLPYDKMGPADKDCLPIALSGKKIVVDAYLGPFQKTKLQETNIRYVHSF